MNGTRSILILGMALAALPFGLSAGSVEAPLNRTNLLEFLDDADCVLPVRSIPDWERRRCSILQAMQAVMGPFPGEAKNCPLDVKVLEEVDCGAYWRRCLSYASEPGSRVPAYLLIPKEALSGSEKLAPGVLCLHQTHPRGQDVVVGLGDSPNDEYGVELAVRGYVCLVPAYPLLANYDPDLAGLGYQSGTMKAIWDNIRGLDLLETLPFVRKGSFGVIGHSLGGHNGLFTACFDDRIKVVISSCGFDSFRDYMDGNITGWTSPRYMPRLAEYGPSAVPFDFAEVLGLLAPRCCFVSAPIGDSNFQWWSVERIALAAEPVYELYGVPGNLQIVHPDCGHGFPKEVREEAYRVLDRELRRD
jgi:hypothetical protein